MAEIETTPAPEIPSTGTMSALDAAIVNDDLAALRKATFAEQKGTPLPPVARPGVLSDEEFEKLSAKKDSGEFLTDAERISWRRTSNERRQKAINEKANKAAERVVADYDTQLKAKDEEIAKLRRDLETRQTPPRVPAQLEAATTGRPVAVPETPSAPVAPDPNDAQKYPGGVYDPQYIEDKAVWRFQTDQAKRDKETAERQQREAGQRAWIDAKRNFYDQLKTAKEKDADYDAVMAGELASRRLIPLEELDALKAANVIPKDAQPGPDNFLASYLVGQSSIGYDLLKHFHQHPEDLSRVLADGPRALYHLEGQLLAQRSAPPSAPAPSPKKVLTDAPAPVTALGTREAAPTNPLEAAIAAGKDSLTGGVRDFKAAWREQNAPTARR